MNSRKGATVFVLVAVVLASASYPALHATFGRRIVPSSPGAAMRGPYVNSGSRDVGPASESAER